MIELYKIKAIVCAILAVATGLSVLGLMWFIVFTPWPTVIGLVIMLVFQLMLMIYFIGNMTYARVHADIKAVEE
jgi:hypothetical protein